MPKVCTMKDKKISKLFKDSGKKQIEKTSKIGTVLKEFKAGKLHSGSKKGPKVTKKPQALAIAISESKKKKK